MSDKQPQAPDPQRKGNPGLGIAGRLSVLGVVGILYLVFVGVVVLGFSGYILRVSLEREISAAGGGLDELFFAINQEKAFAGDLDMANSEVAAKAKEIAEAQARYQSLQAEGYLNDASILAGIMPIGLHISRNSALFDEGYVERFKAILMDQTDFERVQKLTALIAAPDFAEIVDVEAMDQSIEFFREKIKEISALTRENEASFTRIGAADSEVEQLNKQLLELQSYRDSVANGLKDLRAGDIYKNRSRVMSFEPLAWGVFYSLIQIPTIILTMIVTIAAGGLGSVVSFTRALLVDTTPTSARQLFVSVGEGVAAAVAIFFLAGAGMLMLSTGTGGSGAEISPYMVAFLAFVSGFMAEDAFQSIQRTGKNLFKQPDEKTT